jgi:hypothetical protein
MVKLVAAKINVSMNAFIELFYRKVKFEIAFSKK